MSRALIAIYGPPTAREPFSGSRKAPFGTRLEFKAVKRSIDQNSKMWASLTDIAQQVVWHGQRLKPDDWKLMFLDALKRELRIVPNIDGNGFVNLGRSSSDLSKAEMSDLAGDHHGLRRATRRRLPRSGKRRKLHEQFPSPSEIG
jgi:hypothetical protein